MTTGLSSELLQEIERAVCSLRYGAVHIQVHNGRIVQIEKHERIRLELPTDRTTGVPRLPRGRG